MKNGRTIITGAKLVLPYEVIKGDILINGDIIEAIFPCGLDFYPGFDIFPGDSSSIDAEGMYVLPGIIDIHSDAVEREIAPRPHAYFPIEFSLYELDKKIVSSGITTIYHSLSLSGAGAVGVREDQMVIDIIDNIVHQNLKRSMARSLVHLRYEVTHIEGAPLVKELLGRNLVHMFSFMDHTPGQGQYTKPGTYEQYAMKTYGLSPEKIQMITDEAKNRRQQVDPAVLKELSRIARVKGIKIASHDDDTYDKLNAMLELGVTISEFPINIETALYAKAKGVFIAVGAPNVVRNASHGNNLKATEAITAGAADILCSDYYPPAMLAAVFKLMALGIKLQDAVRMISTNPAKAAGIDHLCGSIEVGKRADLVIVELENNHPFVRKTIVGGTIVYQSNFIQHIEQGRERHEEFEYSRSFGS